MYFFFLHVQFLDKVEVEMRTCEEPRPPNGPSPIAITAGQRYSFMHFLVSKRMWNLLGHFPTEVAIACVSASTALQRRWWRACLSGSTPSPSRCRLGPSTRLSSSGSYKATVLTPNGNAATSDTPASLTQREERWDSDRFHPVSLMSYLFLYL